MPRDFRLADIPDRLTVDGFWELVGAVEHEQLDFKTQASPRVAETVAAMSMTHGGLIVLGVNDDREFGGCPLSQGTLDAVMRAAHTCTVDVQLKEVVVGRTKLTVVAVPEVRGRIVTTSDGRVLRRVGSDTQPLVGDSLGRFVTERTNRSAEEETVPVPDFDDLDLDLINRALTAEGRPTATRDRILRALIDLDVAVPAPAPADPRVTSAAVLLFAKHPRRHLVGASVQVVRRTGVGPGPGPTAAREEIDGPLPVVLDRVLTFIESHTASHEAVIGTRRERLPEYPVAVLREAVLNALAHRDYGLSGATIDVTIWDDRIEVRSPGPLPGHITLENIRQEHYSRNRRLMQVLKMLRLVEEYGEGVDRMFGEMEARLMEPPLFTATPSSVSVTLFSRSALSVEDQAWLALVGHFELSPQERRILVMAKREGSITRRMVRAAMPDTDAQTVLGGAVAKGLLVMTGERGGARYVLSDEVVLRAGAAGLEARSRQRQMLLDALRRRGSLSTTEALGLLQESNLVLARHLLNDLVRARLAVARGHTRARRYYNV